MTELETSNEFDSPPPPKPRGIRSTSGTIIAASAAVALVAAGITGGVLGTQAMQRETAIANAQAALGQLQSSERQERIAGTELIRSIDDQLTAYRETESLPSGLKDLAAADSIERLVDARAAAAEQLLTVGVDVDDERARAAWPADLLGEQGRTLDLADPASADFTLDLEGPTQQIEADTETLLAWASLVEEKVAEIRGAREEVAGSTNDITAAIAAIARTTANPTTALLEANPKATASSRAALTDAQVALEAAANIEAAKGESDSREDSHGNATHPATADPTDVEVAAEVDGEIIDLAITYVKAAATVRDSHAAAVAAESQNATEYVDPSTGKTVPNPYYNPQLPAPPPDNGGGGTPSVHPRADYCASTGFANNQLCLDAVPATFSTNAAYVPWSSCNPGYYSTHSVGWGGNSNAGYSFPWSATVDGPTVTYYVCG